MAKWTRHPITNLAMGLILFISGVAETYENFSHDLSGFHLGTHHGVMIFGLVNILASIPDIIEGLGSGIDYFEYSPKGDDVE